MSQIVVITNPHARANAKDPGRRDRLARLLGERGEVIETQHLEALDDCTRQLVDRDMDFLGICGGDGTNHLVLTSLVKTFAQARRGLPPIALLKGGSMNTVRWNIDLTDTAEKNLAALAAKKAAGEAYKLRRLNVLRVDAVGEQYGFFYGNGYVYNWLREYYGEDGVSGPRRAAETAYRAIGSVIARGEMAQRLAQRIDAEIVIDGRTLPIRDFGMIMAGFIEYIGIGFKSLYRAWEQEGAFHVVATNLKPSQITAQVHRFFAGKRLAGTHHYDEVAREVVIRADTPLGYTLDGELYEATAFRVATGPAIDIVMG